MFAGSYMSLLSLSSLGSLEEIAVPHIHCIGNLSLISFPVTTLPSGAVCAKAAAQQNFTAKEKVRNTLQELSSWLKMPKVTQHVGEAVCHQFPNFTGFSSCV